MKHFMHIISKRKLLVCTYLILGIALALLSAYTLSYFKSVLDALGNHSLKLHVIIIYGMLLVGSCILNYLDEYPWQILSEGIYYDLKLEAIKKLSIIDFKSYQSLDMGGSIQQIENGASAGKSMLFDFYFQLIRNLIPSLMFNLFFIVSIQPSIVGYICFGYILTFVISNILIKYLYHFNAKILNNEELFNKYLVRALMELAVFRIHNRFPSEINKARQSAQTIIHASAKMKLIHEAFFAIFELFVTVIKVIVLYVSWQSQSLTIGGVVALLLLIDKAYAPIAIFNVIFVQYKLDKSAFARFVNLLDKPNDLQLNSGQQLQALRGEITLEGVCYFADDKAIIKDINLDISKGKKIAFVGESGCGKSTLAKLILGLCKPNTGKVYVDGYHLSEVHLNSYYSFVSYVSQDPPIFNGTLRENIIFDHDICDELVIAALSKVGLEDYYKALPYGLDTKLGERGTQLSGGEKQRIAIARVYFFDAQLIILDEATSALDAITEELVMANLLDALKDKTVITIAHRLNTIKSVDTIHLMDKGQIVCSGDFKTLLQHNIQFKTLWNTTTTIS